MSTPVRRDQFVVSPAGVLHKPTGALFAPATGNPTQGTVFVGQLGNVLDNGEDYRTDEVKAMMNELWGEHLRSTGQLPQS